MYKLYEWVDIDKIDCDLLSTNPNAIDLLKEKQDKINWNRLSLNPNAIDLLKEKIKNNQKFSFVNIKKFLKKKYFNIRNFLKIKYYKYLLSTYTNPNDFLTQTPAFNWFFNCLNCLNKELTINKNKINWNTLSKNPNAISLLKENQDKINWFEMSKNPNAISLLKENQDKINWNYLSSNPNAISLLKENQDKNNWYFLSNNSNANELLKENKDKIYWPRFSKNPNIFTYDYKKMKESGIAEDKKTVRLFILII